MADGLSIAASITGIATAALQSVQFISKTIDTIKDIPDTVKNIKADLQAVQLVLHHLNTALRGDASEIILNNDIKSAVENCARVCAAFEKLLNHWMRRSTEEKTFWIDRWRIGLFGQDRIQTFKAQLGDCKGTLNVALSTASVIAMSQQEFLVRDMKDVMLRQNEADLQQNIFRSDDQRTRTDRSLQEFLTRGMIQQNEESEYYRQELLHEIRQQQASNDTFRKVCEEALSTTVYKRTGQKIKGVRATHYSTALAGFINTSGEESRITQDISDVMADDRSVAVAGVIGNVNLRDLRPCAHDDNVGSR